MDKMNGGETNEKKKEGEKNTQHIETQMYMCTVDYIYKINKILLKNKMIF